MRSSLTTLLLDLDGTLLDVDMGLFMEAYFPLAAARLGGRGRIRRTAGAMAAAARAMFANRDPGRTLDRIFFETLGRELGRTPEDLRRSFEEFHAEEFQRMRRLTRPVPGARALLERAREAGLTVALATNPVFLLGAIRERVRWAGLEGFPFALVTGAELMHRTKPRVEYYGEILATLGRSPGECLMVGDDPVMDMSAKKAGIPTWLAVRKTPRLWPVPLADRVGTLEELADELAERSAVTG